MKVNLPILSRRRNFIRINRVSEPFERAFNNIALFHDIRQSALREREKEGERERGRSRQNEFPLAAIYSILCARAGIRGGNCGIPKWLHPFVQDVIGLEKTRIE